MHKESGKLTFNSKINNAMSYSSSPKKDAKGIDSKKILVVDLNNPTSHSPPPHVKTLREIENQNRMMNESEQLKKIYESAIKLGKIS